MVPCIAVSTAGKFEYGTIKFTLLVKITGKNNGYDFSDPIGFI